MSDMDIVRPSIDEQVSMEPPAMAVLDLMLERMADDLDQPELWEDLPVFVAHLPELPSLIAARLSEQPYDVSLRILSALLRAVAGDTGGALEALEPLSVSFSQSIIIHGAIFHVHRLADPDNPRYQLEGKLCPNPFQQMDVLESSAHLCCASYLPTAVGNLHKQDWQEVWNSSAAQSIRSSLHDGSFRQCNKMNCPVIQGGLLVPADELAARSPEWHEIVTTQATEMKASPTVVNLAYDKTCNLSCPSCRTSKYAADSATRESYARLQEWAILPMLRGTKTVFITGSGDPFASKNFRALMERLGPDDYPDLRFQIMTNGMLLTPAAWDTFPALHGRVAFLRISLDAATGPTHERLRRGARWPVMERNLAFAGELRAKGLVDRLDLAFTVQTDNYREMGDAIDLAKKVGADCVAFARLTNWGTYSEAEYREKAVFLAGHPEHAKFLAAMQDPRLQDPVAWLLDLEPFAGQPIAA